MHLLINLYLEFAPKRKPFSSFFTHISAYFTFNYPVVSSYHLSDTFLYSILHTYICLSVKQHDFGKYFGHQHFHICRSTQNYEKTVKILKTLDQILHNLNYKLKLL